MRLLETYTFENKATGGVLPNVKVLGEMSKNGYAYPASTRAKAKGLFEGMKVNLDHNKKPSINSRIGKLTNITEREDGLYADLHYLTSHPFAKTLEEAAERMSDLMGLSINARGTVAKDSEGKSFVESIDGCVSVDLVESPATVRGLYEEEQPQEEENVDHYWEACKQEIMQILDSDSDIKAKLKEIKDHLQKYEKTYGEKDTEEEPAAAPQEDKQESLRAMVANLKEEVKALKQKALIKEPKSGITNANPVLTDWVAEFRRGKA